MAGREQQAGDLGTAPSRPTRLDARRLLIVAEAVAALALAALAIRWLPFERAVRSGSLALGKRRKVNVELLAWGVRAAARRLPWRSVCFQQGLALQAMLRRRGVDARLHYGVGQPDGELGAHVWVRVGETVAIGGEQAGRFAAVAVYP